MGRCDLSDGVRAWIFLLQNSRVFFRLAVYRSGNNLRLKSWVCAKSLKRCIHFGSVFISAVLHCRRREEILPIFRHLQSATANTLYPAFAICRLNAALIIRKTVKRRLKESVEFCDL